MCGFELWMALSVCGVFMCVREGDRERKREAERVVGVTMRQHVQL